MGICWVWPTPRMPVGNEGYRDALLKMFHNPGGHWNPGRGPHPRYHFIFAAVVDINICVYLNLLKVLGKKKKIKIFSQMVVKSMVIYNPYESVKNQELSKHKHDQTCGCFRSRNVHPKSKISNPNLQPSYKQENRSLENLQEINKIINTKDILTILTERFRSLPFCHHVMFTSKKFKPALFPRTLSWHQGLRS